MPPPTWLIDTVIPNGAMVAEYGQPETKKSFVAIDIAMSVATGLPWMGHEVEQGYVIYISAEGGAGIGKRARAWLTYYGLNPEDAEIAWLVESISVHVDSDQMVGLMERIQNEIRRQPSLIVVDTLARCFDGNENEQEDMNRFVAGVDLLRMQFGCAVLIVHHTRLGGDRERGNTAFRGGADTMLFVENEDAVIRISCAKQKDFEHFPAMELELFPVEGTDSCIVRKNSQVVNAELMTDQMIEALEKIQPATWDDWREALGWDRSKFTKWYDKLRKTKKVAKNSSGGWVVV